MIDHDGIGQRSGAAGHRTIDAAYGAPAEYPPSGRWIGMTGTDAQIYGLVYADGGWTAYGTGNWIMSQRQVTLGAGATFTLARRLVATGAGEQDPWSPLEHA